MDFTALYLVIPALIVPFLLTGLFSWFNLKKINWLYFLSPLLSNVHIFYLLFTNLYSPPNDEKLGLYKLAIFALYLVLGGFFIINTGVSLVIQIYLSHKKFQPQLKADLESKIKEIGNNE